LFYQTPLIHILYQTPVIHVLPLVWVWPYFANCCTMYIVICLPSYLCSFSGLWPAVLHNIRYQKYKNDNISR
jgi:hypothetical protein